MFSCSENHASMGLNKACLKDFWQHSGSFSLNSEKSKH